ncbi:MAG: hypothetical protein ACR2JK_11810 [Geodermatophilaceae bacterium]
MSVGGMAAAVGKGVFAGAVGTAAMTVSSTVEAKLSQREPSTAPADAAAKVLGVEPVGDQEKARFSTLVHWGYGTGWGAPRGLLAAAGLPAPFATAAHLGLVWGSEVVMLPQLDVAPPLWEMAPKSIAIDLFHHFVYALATGLAYSFLDRSTARA